MPSAAMGERTVPATVPDDDDDVVVSLETARVSEERADLEAASRWLHRAAAAARRQGRPERAGALSRCATQVLGEGRFERKEPEEQVLGGAEADDFSDTTIVETAAEIARKVEPVAGPDVASDNPPLVVDPTPLAPLTGQPKPAVHQAIRVAVRKALGGKFEARPLAAGESPFKGEQEALLVPVQGDTKLS